MNKPRDEDGRIMVLTLGFFVIIGLLTVGIVDTSTVFLRHRELANTADELVLWATEGLDESVFYGTGEVLLDPAEVRSIIAARLPTGIEADIEVDEDSVRLRLSQEVALPVVPPGWPPTTIITAESSSRLMIGD